MILSVSRRTDVPALFSDWFFTQFKAGEVFVPNPFIRGGATARLSVAPVRVVNGERVGDVEGIVFWTKNPAPMLDRLGELEGVPYYFQHTLNGYERRYEGNLPDVSSRLATFRQLAKRCKVVWRYDPIFVSGSVDIAWQKERFEMLAGELEGATDECVINVLRGKPLDMRAPVGDELTDCVGAFVESGKRHGITVKGCAEINAFGIEGLGKAACVDYKVFERMIGFEVKKGRANGATRLGCACMDSVDIGTYNTCTNACAYCYATRQNSAHLSTPTPNIYNRPTYLAFDYGRPCKVRDSD